MIPCLALAGHVTEPECTAYVLSAPDRAALAPCRAFCERGRSLARSTGLPDTLPQPTVAGLDALLRGMVLPLARRMVIQPLVRQLRKDMEGVEGLAKRPRQPGPGRPREWPETPGMLDRAALDAAFATYPERSGRTRAKILRRRYNERMPARRRYTSYKHFLRDLARAGIGVVRLDSVQDSWIEIPQRSTAQTPGRAA